MPNQTGPGETFFPAIGIETVTIGSFGPQAFEVLNTAGLDIYTVSHIGVAEALRRYGQGELDKL